VLQTIHPDAGGKHGTGFPVPEILRVPLENISLTVKVMREEEDVKVR
jgi:hypothetical protein